MSGHWWWHDFLPWLEPVATAVGVCAAIVAAIYAGRVFNRERARDDRLEQRQRQEQASLVSAWLMSQDVTVIETGEEFAHLQIGIRNASMLPVVGVHVLAAGPEHEDMAWEADVLPPDSSLTVQSVVPHETFAMGMVFTDSAGVSWRRDWRGRLTEILEPDDA